MSESDAPAAEWYPDPSGKFQFRYWDGEQWTGHVSTDGATEWDPPGEGAPAEESTSEQPAAQEAAAEPAASSTPDFSGTQTISPAAQQAALAAASAPAAAAAEDDEWAPQPATQAQPEPAPAQDAAPAQAEPAAEQPEPAAAVEPQQAAPQDQPEAQPQGATIDADEPSDANLVANMRASIDDDVREWLDAVAAQVEPRLSRIERTWTTRAEADAARACAYGLLVGHLGRLHPHMRPELSMVAEAHPSFTTLTEGQRLDTLEQIAGDPGRAAAWLGPLIGTTDEERIKMLFD